jgi:hypothetical protein
MYTCLLLLPTLLTSIHNDITSGLYLSYRQNVRDCDCYRTKLAVPNCVQSVNITMVYSNTKWLPFTCGIRWWLPTQVILPLSLCVLISWLLLQHGEKYTRYYNYYGHLWKTYVQLHVFLIWIYIQPQRRNPWYLLNWRLGRPQNLCGCCPSWKLNTETSVIQQPV